MEPVNMNKVIEDALRVLHNQIKHQKIAIDKKYDSDLPDVKGNFANLGQVFINIIQNALQSFSAGEGAIVLYTTYHQDTDQVIVECRDNGVGIPTEHLQDIFKPFYTSKAPGQGTGLGLYICHEIVRRHGGHIAVTSEAGKGSVFRVELPCKRSES
jgi:two-component system NtrC family sensor kinase